jgi:rod shape-determining protein MreB
MKDGVIADFDVTQAMLKYFINRALGQRTPLVRPRVIISIPTGAPLSKRELSGKQALQAGAKKPI